MTRHQFFPACPPFVNTVYWLTKTIARNKGFPRKWKQICLVEKVYLVKTKSAVSFSFLMWRWSILETGHCVFLEVVSIFPPLVLVKKKKKKKTPQKAKKLFKVSLLSLSKDSLVNFFGKTSRISARSFPSSSVICVRIFKHGPYFLPRKGYDAVCTSASFSFKQN